MPDTKLEGHWVINEKGNIPVATCSEAPKQTFLGE